MSTMSPDSPPAAIPAPDTTVSTSPSPPGLIELFVAFAKMSLAGFGGVLVWARRGIVDQHKWMTGDGVNETFALCHFFARPQHRQPQRGCRIALSRDSRRHRGLCRPGRAPRGDRHRPGGVICAL